MRKRYDYDVLIPILIVSIIGLAAHEIHDMFPIDVSKVITTLVVLCTSFLFYVLCMGNRQPKCKGDVVARNKRAKEISISRQYLFRL